jgi:hypothetical protein
VHGGIAEGEAGIEKALGNHASAGEQSFIGHLSQGDTERKSGSTKNRRPVDCVAQGMSESGAGDRVRCDEIDGAGEISLIQEEVHRRYPVIEANPAHPLTAIAERAAKAETKDGQHLGECTSSGPNHDARTQVHNANAGVFCRRCGFLPGAAEIGEEACSWVGRFIEQFLSAIAIDACEEATINTFGGRVREASAWHNARVEVTRLSMSSRL